jgi:hypothetical protein
LLAPLHNCHGNLFETTTMKMSVTFLTKDPCQHSIGQVVISLIEREQMMQEINFGSNSGTARKHDLAEGRFIP